MASLSDIRLGSKVYGNYTSSNVQQPIIRLIPFEFPLPFKRVIHIFSPIAFYIQVWSALLHILKELCAAVVAVINTLPFVVGPGRETDLLAGQIAGWAGPTSPHQHAIVHQLALVALGARVRWVNGHLCFPPGLTG